MKSLVPMNDLYALIGLIVAMIAIQVALNKKHPTRWTSALFWGIFAFTFIAGDFVPPLIIGYLVIVMVILAALGRVKAPSHSEGSGKDERIHLAQRLKWKIFIPALAIPVVTVIGTLTLDRLKWGSAVLVKKEDVTLVSLGLATIIAFAIALYVTKAKMNVPFQEGSKLLQAVGWAVLLPQMLAALGGIFDKAGVGNAVSHLVKGYLPADNGFVAVVAYCVGMTLFTMVMGNAFAAFAVITGGIGLPLIVHAHGGNPAIMAALGMFSGYCGTLMTPMAANFNIVPAMLLNLDDQNAVVKKQIPTGIALFLVNMFLMYFLVYRF
ncbi:MULTISPECIES: DUF979 domain-containing protein [Thermoactinomyces]|nr:MULTISPECIES: DUF979 domain-containing protein [Thermoactinomyces]